MELILMRGAPGAQKSEIASRLYPEHKQIKSRHFFKDRPYDRALLKASHFWCEKEVERLLHEGERVVVMNTFIKAWELENFLSMGFITTIVKAEGYHAHATDVPYSAVVKMQAAYEPVFGEEVVSADELSSEKAA